MHKRRASCGVCLASVTFVRCVETAKDTARVTIGNRPKLSSGGTIFNDVERPVTHISRSHHYLTLNILETVRDRDIVTREY